MCSKLYKIHVDWYVLGASRSFVDREVLHVHVYDNSYSQTNSMLHTEIEFQECELSGLSPVETIQLKIYM